MNQGNLNQAAAHRGELRIGEPHMPVWWSPPEGLGLHRAAATSSSFGLSKPCGGAVFSPTQQAPLAPLWLLGPNPRRQEGVGPKLITVSIDFSFPIPTSFIMSKSFVSQKEPMQWAARRQDLSKIEHTKKCDQLQWQGCGGRLWWSEIKSPTRQYPLFCVYGDPCWA